MLDSAVSRARAALAVGTVAVAVGVLAVPPAPTRTGGVPVAPVAVGVVYVVAGGGGLLALRTGRGRSLRGVAGATLGAYLCLLALFVARAVGLVGPAPSVPSLLVVAAQSLGAVPALPLPLLAGAAAVEGRDRAVLSAVAVVVPLAVVAGDPPALARLADPVAWGDAAVSVGLSAFLGGPLYYLGAAWARVGEDRRRRGTARRRPPRRGPRR